MDLNDYKKIFEVEALPFFENDVKLHDLIIGDYIRYEIQRYIYINNKLTIGEFKIGYDKQKKLYILYEDDFVYSDNIEYTNLHNEIRKICSQLLSEFEI